MTEEEQIQARIDFVYQSALHENLITKMDKETALNGIRKLLEVLSVAEVVRVLIYPYTPAPFFDDSITTIRIPSGKVAFIGLNWESYHSVTEQEKIWCDYAVGRSDLCHVFAEKHNIAWTLADSDGTTHLVHNEKTNMLSIVDWTILEQEDVLGAHENVLGSLSCEGFVYLVDYEQYLNTQDFNHYDGEIIVHDVEPGVYEYVAMSLKDDKYFTPGLFEHKRTDYATLEWVAPL